MRAYAIVIAALCLIAPLAASVRVPVPVVAVGAVFDPDDATLMLLLARGIDPEISLRRAPAPAPGDTLAAALSRLGERASAPLAPEDIAAFAALDARVQAPLLTLSVAVEAAWDGVDAAFARLTPREREELGVLALSREMRDPRFAQLYAGVDKRQLIESGIMLTDTVERVVVPQLQEAVRAGAWPANPVADPRGVIRLGGTGNDLEQLDRIIQIDPKGNDRYENNAGGTTMLDPLYGLTDWNILTPIAISIDFEGDDVYTNDRLGASHGGSTLDGFGILLDHAGDDHYSAPYAQGLGFGVLRDFSGSDDYTTMLGIGNGIPLAIARDDGGDDDYRVYGSGGGYAGYLDDVGLLWDRAGRDAYLTQGSPGRLLYGWAEAGGRGWLADEGAFEDHYEAADWPDEPIKHGCNDCTWERGSGFTDEGPGGKGNDNAGGLAYLIAYQDPAVRRVG